MLNLESKGVSLPVNGKAGFPQTQKSGGFRDYILEPVAEILERNLLKNHYNNLFVLTTLICIESRENITM